MNVVYILTFEKRIKEGNPPYFYIGSKSNCNLSEGCILDKNGNPYYGSSTWDGYGDMVIDDTPKYKILWKSNECSYDELITKEKEFQIQYDCVASPEFFNKALASVSNYADPNYATFKHIQTGKIVRLPIYHPMVLAEEYKGVTYGCVLDNERKEYLSKINTGEKNAFYGRTHTNDTKDKISKANRGRIKSDRERELTSLLFKGKPKTETHKKKISERSKGKVSLKNVDTGECVRIDSEDKHLYDPEKWKNPYSLTDDKKTCFVCGLTESRIVISRWHNENCGKNRFKPWEKKSGQQFYYDWFLQIIDFVKNNKKGDMSSKRYYSNFVWPFIDDLGIEKTDKHKSMIKYLIKSYWCGKITDETIEQFKLWRESFYENQKH